MGPDFLRETTTSYGKQHCGTFGAVFVTKPQGTPKLVQACTSLSKMLSIVAWTDETWVQEDCMLAYPMWTSYGYAASDWLSQQKYSLQTTSNSELVTDGLLTQAIVSSRQ